jgi:hypothetical protein
MRKYRVNQQKFQQYDQFLIEIFHLIVQEILINDQMIIQHNQKVINSNHMLI